MPKHTLLPALNTTRSMMWPEASAKSKSATTSDSIVASAVEASPPKNQASRTRTMCLSRERSETDGFIDEREIALF
jgi:hypothetical protein